MKTLKDFYPWKALGKLFFRTAGGQDSVCSASVIGRRVVATAGHCLYDGARRAFHSNFLFVPGFHSGTSPFGGFGWRYAVVTGSWAAGGGAVPNAADFGMLVVNDVVRSGATKRVGELTGQLGWKTFATSPNHINLFGYPCNLDTCQILQETSAQVWRTVSPNNAEAGSDQGGGSSGGPWVQDFGIAAAGQPAREAKGNLIVGIQSYRYTDPSIKVVGTSILNNEWVATFNMACNQGPGNCS